MHHLLPDPVGYLKADYLSSPPTVMSALGPGKNMLDSSPCYLCVHWALKPTAFLSHSELCSSHMASLGPDQQCPQCQMFLPGYKVSTTVDYVPFLASDHLRMWWTKLSVYEDLRIIRSPFSPFLNYAYKRSCLVVIFIYFVSKNLLL